MVIKKNIKIIVFFALLVELFFLPQNKLYAQADDVTMIGSNQGIYFLTDEIQEKIKTSDNITATLQIEDAIVEKDRVLIRFFVWGLPEEWGSHVTDLSRTEGHYLPVAEAGTSGGEWLTPSSRSRYSLLSSNGELIVAGLLEYITREQPQILALNFNQIPFDFEPLAEGVSTVLHFSKEIDRERQKINSLSVTKNDVTMTLLHTAQTEGSTMVQPSISLKHENETLTQYGWVTVKASDGRQYALRRDYPYGFNLTDDILFSTGNAYTFAPVTTESPLTISLDYIYVQRSIPENTITLDIQTKKSFTPIKLPLDDFSAVITGAAEYSETVEKEEIPVLRLFIDTDPEISAINFYEEMDSDSGVIQAECGIITDTDDFACDIQLQSDQQEKATLKYKSFDYRIDGPWEINWTPVPIDAGELYEAPTKTPYPSGTEMNMRDYFSTADDEVLEVLDLMDERSRVLSQREGWIIQKTEINKAIPGGDFPALIPHSKKDKQINHVIQETYDWVNSEGILGDAITLLRNVETGEIIQGNWYFDTSQIVLPQMLFLNNSSFPSIQTRFHYGSEFLSLLDTSAEYRGRTETLINGIHCWKYSFHESLMETAEEIPTPSIDLNFTISIETGIILESVIRCSLNGNNSSITDCVTKKTIEVSFQPQLPDTLATQIAGVIIKE